MIELLAAAVLATGLRAASPPRGVEAEPSRSVLWVGAHPDDEILAAPLLAHLCGLEGAHCTLVVLTQGEAGHCLLPAGCHPSLAAVRRRELARSARRLGADWIAWELPDGGGLAGLWAMRSGGEEALVARLAATMAATRAETVVTFDPRHGTTCHGDHRTVGRLVVAAARVLARPPDVELLETLAAVTSSPYAVRLSPAAPPPVAGIVAFDVAGSGEHRALWANVPRLAAIYRSQVPAEAVRTLARLPSRQRVVYTAPAEVALASPAIPACP